ncbi:MAG: hypothetical protein HYX35_03550 [Proteobacteria bacterium]|nr:hypothetical protein [Pseudomonadota bacterium]
MKLKYGLCVLLVLISLPYAELQGGTGASSQRKQMLRDATECVALASRRSPERAVAAEGALECKSPERISLETSLELASPERAVVSRFSDGLFDVYDPLNIRDTSSPSPKKEKYVSSKEDLHLFSILAEHAEKIPNVFMALHFADVIYDLFKDPFLPYSSNVAKVALHCSFESMHAQLCQSNKKLKRFKDLRRRVLLHRTRCESLRLRRGEGIGESCEVVF